MKREDFLKRAELFSGVSPRYLKAIATMCSERSFKKGDYLVRQMSQQFVDSRKAHAWLYGITQVPSLIPRAILQSCNNSFFGNEKGAEDRDIEVGILARSEKGFVDEPWRRFLACLPVAQMTAKLGYTHDRAQLEPMKMQPAMLSLPQPPDSELSRLLKGGTR